MNPSKLIFLLAGIIAGATALKAQVVPNQLSYRGHVAVNGQGFNGDGDFKFALMDGAGTTTLWSNDGTAAGEPVNAVTLDLNFGFYSVRLGDANLANMTPIPPSVFSEPDVRLRIWFDDGQNGFQQLTPDQPIVSVGYAMMAEQVPDGSITSAKLAPDAIDDSLIADGSVTTADLAPNSVNSGHILDGEVHTADLADNAVTSAKLADIIDLGSASASGRLNVWNGIDDITAIELNANSHQISTYGSDGQERIRLWGDSYGQLRLHDTLNNTLTAWLTAGNDGAIIPQLMLYSAGGNPRAQLRGHQEGGDLMLSSDAGPGLSLQADGTSNGPELRLWDAASQLRLHAVGNGGMLQLFGPNGGNPAVRAVGDLGQVAALNHLGVAQDVGMPASLWSAALARNGNGGFVRTRDELGNRTGEMVSGVEGGYLNLFRGRTSTSPNDPRDPNGTPGTPGSEVPIILLNADEGINNGGVIRVRQFDGEDGAVLYASALDDNGAPPHLAGGGALSLRKLNGNTVGLQAYGGQNNGSLWLYNNTDTLTVALQGGPGAGSLWLNNAAGLANVGLWSWENEEGVVSVRNQSGEERVYLWGRNSDDTDAGQLGLKDAAGVERITLDADRDGDARIITEVLEITGGSDLSEQFEIQAAEQTPEPGMLVCIDPDHPGQLVVSTRAYDRTTAGVISGAGGVKPGMLMGQKGSIADGEYPVALTGRVYCRVDAQYGAIEPGDLITTSNTPGHGMKVTEHDQARGAIVGKAMTGLESGTGLVLVLVSLQ